MHAKKSKVSSKTRLGRFHSSNDEEALETSVGYGETTSSLPKNWKYALVGCGSNAFGQLYMDDLMCSTLQHISIPTDSQSSHEIEQISAGPNMSAVLASNNGGLYYWGSGNSTQYRTPTALKIDSRCQVKQISCGESHSAFLSQSGKVFTFGKGDHGALGHGNKASLISPKLVAALSKLTCFQVSCGPFHTAFIAGEGDDVGVVRLPPSSAPSNPFAEWEGDPCGKFDRVFDDTMICAMLYTCGEGKTGQLGHGEKSQMIKTPRPVKWFSENGYRVGKVSCGLHHTVTIAAPVHSMRFITAVYSFGWGEHGRLGHGNENSCNYPVEVVFPEPFHAIDISAGEQHTLASSGRENGCYAWGSNSFGQCGAGSPSSTEYSLSPVKVPIPEGIRISQVCAGGRHSAAISSCGKFLLWGWGEEGQLANGSENSNWLPRPVRLPELQESKCIPITASLGMCHTLVVVRNKDYQYSPVTENVENHEVSVENAMLESEPTLVPFEANISRSVNASLSCALSPAPLLTEEISHKQSVFVVQECTEEEKPIQSLKDILNSRETRDTDNKDIQTVLGRYSSVPDDVTVDTVKIDQSQTQKEESSSDNGVDELQPQGGETDGADEKESELTVPVVTKEKEKSMDQYFYKEGQNLENCFVANSARRAELRKQKKASMVSKPTAPKSTKPSSFSRRPSK